MMVHIFGGFKSVGPWGLAGSVATAEKDSFLACLWHIFAPAKPECLGFVLCRRASNTDILQSSNSKCVASESAYHNLGFELWV